MSDQKEGDAQITFDDLKFEVADGDQSTPGTPSNEGGSQATEQQTSKGVEQTEGQTQQQAAEKKDAEEDLVVKQLGKDVILKVKGKDYPISDFTSEEVRNFLQKGLRADQLMREAAEARKAAEDQIARAQQEARYFQEYINREQPRKSQEPAAPQVPKELQVSEYDTPEVKALKQFSTDLMGRVSQLEHGYQVRQYNEAEHALLSEVESLKETYPLASPEEVVAVKMMYPKAPVEEIMRKSNEHYSSEKYVENVFRHRPEVFRQFREKVIADYLARKGQPNTYKGRAVGSSVTRIPQERTSRPEDWDFDKAEAEAFDRLKKMGQSIIEEEQT